MRHIIISILALGLLAACSSAPVKQSRVDMRFYAESVKKMPHREHARRLRDHFRHPGETLHFLGLQPDMHVVELWPGGGWYTDYLAPLVREQGQLTVASFDSSRPPKFRGEVEQRLRERFKKFPEVFDRVAIRTLAPPDQVAIAESGSADLVLSFRNSHNWLREGQLVNVYAAAYTALKPGGILGIVQHRAIAGTTPEESKRIGYMDQDYIIRQAKKAGFKLEASSEINANPRDTKDYPKGVWTLPPSYRLGHKDRERYAMIGESDRMTLRFRKPN